MIDGIIDRIIDFFDSIFGVVGIVVFYLIFGTLLFIIINFIF